MTLGVSKLKIHLSCLCLLVGTALSGCHSTRWQDVRLEDGKYFVSFPGKPRHTVSRKAYASGVRVTQNYVYKDERRKMTFGISYAGMNLPSHSPEVADSIMDGMDFKHKGVLPKEKLPFTWGEYTGRELRYDLQNGRRRR